MSAALDPRLDALLAELSPPPVPAGLAERIAAAVQSTAQEPHSRRARRAAWRDRRGRWRRGLVIGAGAVGLAFSGAVAATLAGVPLPAKVEAVIAKLPLIGKETLQTEAPAPRSRPIERAAESAPPTPDTAPERLQADPVKMHQIRQLRRLAAARQIVEARRAAGLPTPRADRIERRIQRRMEWWRQATPEQRQRYIEWRRQRQEVRRARIEARRGAIMPPGTAPPGPPVAMGPMEPRPRANGPTYGPVDPRSVRIPAEDGHQHRLSNLRAQRLERMRQQRLERQGAPTTTRPAPTTTRPVPTRPAPVRRAPSPVRPEGLRPPVR